MNSPGETDARPMQIRIADDVRLRIECGEYPPGHRLMTSAAMAEHYGTSVGTVRLAVGVLQAQGLVVTAQGKGVYVRGRAKVRRHGIDRYARSRWMGGEAILTAEAGRQGHTADQEIRELAEAPAPAVVADRLSVEPGVLLWVRRRMTRIDGRPNQLADSYYPLDVAAAAPQLREVDTGAGGGFARLEEADFHLSRIREDITTRMPTTPESVTLELSPGTPVAELVRATYTDTGRAVEVMIATIAGDQAAFSYEFPIPD